MFFHRKNDFPEISSRNGAAAQRCESKENYTLKYMLCRRAAARIIFSGIDNPQLS
jgi:hypothetical protein